MQRLIGLLSALALTGCSMHPLSISEHHWQQMTPQQQHEARLEQARQNEAARERYHQQRMQQPVQQHDQQQYPQQRPQSPAYYPPHNARPGPQQAASADWLQCRLSPLDIEVSKNKWRSAHPVAFELQQGSSLDIWLERADKPHQRQRIRVSYDRLNVRVCDAGNVRCAVLAATGQELQRGARQNVATGKIKAVMQCQYPPRNSGRGRR